MDRGGKVKVKPLELKWCSYHWVVARHVEDCSDSRSMSLHHCLSCHFWAERMPLCKEHQTVSIWFTMLSVGSQNDSIWKLYQHIDAHWLLWPWGLRLSGWRLRSCHVQQPRRTSTSRLLTIDHYHSMDSSPFKVILHQHMDFSTRCPAHSSLLPHGAWKSLNHQVMRRSILRWLVCTRTFQIHQ